MDRSIKVTLWIVGGAVCGYVFWLYGSCALDHMCHLSICRGHVACILRDTTQANP